MGQSAQQQSGYRMLLYHRSAPCVHSQRARTPIPARPRVSHPSIHIHSLFVTPSVPAHAASPPHSQPLHQRLRRRSTSSTLATHARVATQPCDSRSANRERPQHQQCSQSRAPPVACTASNTRRQEAAHAASHHSPTTSTVAMLTIMPPPSLPSSDLHPLYGARDLTVLIFLPR